MSVLRFLLSILCILAALPAAADGPLPDAGRALAAGDLDRAEGLFAAAREADPSSPLPHLGLADVDAARGAELDALAHVREAEELAPDRPDVLRRLARLQVAIGAAREALESLKRLRRAAPDDPAGYLLAALVLRDVDKVDDAVALLGDGRERGVHPAALHAELSLLHLGAGRVAEALATADEGLEHHEDDRQLRLARGLALAADPARRDDAVRSLEALLGEGLEPAAEARARLEVADLRLTALTNGTCDDAVLRHLRAVRELRPDDPEVHYRLGRAHRACGDADAAREALLRFRELSRETDAADHADRDAGTALNEIRRLAAEGEAAGALQRLEELAADRPDDDRVHLLRAKILFSAGRGEAALESVIRARELLPGRVEAHYLEGLFASRLGRLDHAEDALRRALALDSGSAESHALLAAILADRGETEAAAEHFRRALAVRTEASPAVHLGYAKVLHELGRDEEAREQIRRAENAGRGDGQPDGGSGGP